MGARVRVYDYVLGMSPNLVRVLDVKPENKPAHAPDESSSHCRIMTNWKLLEEGGNAARVRVEFAFIREERGS